MKPRRRLFWGVLLTVFAWIVLLGPIVVWGFINKDVYFVNNQGTKLTIGAMIGLLFVIILIRGGLKDIDKRFAGLMSMGIVLAMSWFLDAILDDLFWIVLMSMIGYFGYIILTMIANYQLKYWKIYREEGIRQYARQEVQAEIGSV